MKVQIVLITEFRKSREAFDLDSQTFEFAVPPDVAERIRKARTEIGGKLLPFQHLNEKIQLIEEDQAQNVIPQ